MTEQEGHALLGMTRGYVARRRDRWFTREDKQDIASEMAIGAISRGYPGQFIRWDYVYIDALRSLKFITRSNTRVSVVSLGEAVFADGKMMLMDTLAVPPHEFEFSRVCSKCGVPKPIVPEFWFWNRRTDTKRTGGKCKMCLNAANQRQKRVSGYVRPRDVRAGRQPARQA